jgi:ubiquinone/menaquinone biosynthesis C-methylase UbiE
VRLDERRDGVMLFPRAGREVVAFGGAALFRGKDVLDIGAGNGRLTFAVARLARAVVGIDSDAQGIRDAQERAARLGIANARFSVGDAVRLDLGRERFDAAIFSWSLC